MTLMDVTTVNVLNLEELNTIVFDLFKIFI